MIQAIRQTVQVKSDGRIEILATELQEGMEAEVIVLVNESQSSVTNPVETSDAISPPQLEAIAKAQSILRRYVPEGESLVDELIRERHEESERE